MPQVDGTMEKEEDRATSIAADSSGDPRGGDARQGNRRSTPSLDPSQDPTFFKSLDHLP